jgi:SP family sugar:H+ symporter-like MFS transporter
MSLRFAPVVLWLVAFTQSWTGIPWTVSAEVPADDLRDKTLALGAASGYWIGESQLRRVDFAALHF